MEDDPDEILPAAQNPLEKFIQKLAISMNGYTALIRETIKHQKNCERKIDHLILMLSNSQSIDQINGERLNSLLSNARADDSDLREIRRMLMEQHGRLMETGLELRETRKDLEEITGQHTLEKLDGPPSGLHKGGFNISWSMIARNSKRGFVWFATGTGLGVTLYHFISRIAAHAGK